ncbi:MAG: hypothetical protein WB819_16355 [Terriglobia bacterium]
MRTFPTEAYFPLADFVPHDAAAVADKLKDFNIVIKPLKDPVLGRDFSRVTTTLPEDNRRVAEALGRCL